MLPVQDGNLSVKNAPKVSADYLEDKICKTKHYKMQNITVTLKIFLYQLKTF